MLCLPRNTCCTPDTDQPNVAQARPVSGLRRAGFLSVPKYFTVKVQRGAMVKIGTVTTRVVAAVGVEVEVA